MVRVWQWVKGKIQPVTASLALLMLLAYVRSTHLDRFLQPQTFFAWRALFSVFYHKSGLHLFVNTIWTFEIGSEFEKTHGSWSFIGTTTLVIFLSQGLTLLIYLPYDFFTSQSLHVRMHSPQLNTLTLGFSGVLFALHFLLVASRPFQAIEGGLLLSSDHHGLVIEGLSVLAGLQALILPDSHFLNNLCGIVAGIVHINIPRVLKGLMVFAMIIYVKGVHPMSHYMYNIFQKISITTKGYYFHLFHQYYQGRGQLYINNNDDDDDGHERQGQEEEEDETAMDPTLQWECRTCLRKNGVFLGFCESCKEWRTLD